MFAETLFKLNDSSKSDIGILRNAFEEWGYEIYNAFYHDLGSHFGFDIVTRLPAEKIKTPFYSYIREARRVKVGRLCYRLNDYATDLYELDIYGADQYSQFEYIILGLAGTVTVPIRARVKSRHPRGLKRRDVKYIPRPE